MAKGPGTLQPRSSTDLVAALGATAMGRGSWRSCCRPVADLGGDLDPVQDLGRRLSASVVLQDSPGWAAIRCLHSHQCDYGATSQQPEEPDVVEARQSRMIGRWSLRHRMQPK